MGLMDGITKLTQRFLGTGNDASLKIYDALRKRINELEATMQGHDDAALRALCTDLQTRAGDGDGKNIQAEAFALAREVADRRIGAWTGITGMTPIGREAKAISDEQWGDQLSLVTIAKEQLAAGTPQAEIDLPASVYAKVRELSPRSVPPWRMRAHDVQLLGGAVLYDGRIAELKTGEGKTLVAVFPAFLAALCGQKVHVVTVNPYLASRDATWNRPVFEFLGMSVGALEAQAPGDQKAAAYACNLVYGTNSEFGFDYLRDNLKTRLEDQVQTKRDFAIVDEVDSVLIDEARTPLIISGPANREEGSYLKANEVAAGLEVETHFEVDIKDRTVSLTEEGIDKASELFGVSSLFDPEHMTLPHFLDNALKAHHLYLRDQHYLVQAGEVRIVDEFTGRVLAGRRWSEGLHQAIEAKEGVSIQPENQTYATITYQNFFRLYDRLAGMTGTALTEANEFHAIYKLDAVAVPTNRPVIRADLPDLIYGSENEKFDAIAAEVEELQAVGQPMLVGTVTVETSERLSEALKRKGVPHEVLNARQNEREAEIVAAAGGLGAVTIATNMAGRGTDIVLKKFEKAELLKHWKTYELAPKRVNADTPDSEIDEACLDLWAKRWLDSDTAEKQRGQDAASTLAAINKVRREQGWHELVLPSALLADSALSTADLGGLRIIGTERHESRRIDNQLRGRSGRQGDPGSSRFYLSLDDQLMKRFAGPMVTNMMRSLGLKDGVPIESKMVTRAVEKAQKRVEEYHYGVRKNLLEYDQVMNVQRTEVYGQRQRILEGKQLPEFLTTVFKGGLDDLVQEAASDGTRGDDLAARLAERFHEATGLPAPAVSEIPVNDGGDACRDRLMQVVDEGLAKRTEEWGPALDMVLRFVLLDTIDRRWKDHLYAMDHLRSAISLEGYGQRDPKLRYKEEGYKLFTLMGGLIRQDISQMFFRLQLDQRAAGAPGGAPMPNDRFQAGGFAPAGGASPAPAPTAKPGATAVAAAPAAAAAPTAAPNKPGPDDPCPCGSGLPYRHCHGKL